MVLEKEGIKCKAERALEENNYGLAGKLFEKIKDYSRAAEAYSKFEEGLDKSVEMYLKSGMNKKTALVRVAYAAMNLGLGIKAARMLREAGFTGGARRIYSDLGKTYEAKGDFETSAYCYEEAGELENAARMAEKDGDYMATKRLYDTNGDKEKAKEMFNKHLKIFHRGSLLEHIIKDLNPLPIPLILVMFGILFISTKKATIPSIELMAPPIPNYTIHFIIVVAFLILIYLSLKKPVVDKKPKMESKSFK
ncbi:MAG: hypothetical protein QW041_00080 [Candidatus Pacearchaeota archaeon]